MERKREREGEGFKKKKSKCIEMPIRRWAAATVHVPAQVAHLHSACAHVSRTWLDVWIAGIRRGSPCGGGRDLERA